MWMRAATLVASSPNLGAGGVGKPHINHPLAALSARATGSSARRVAPRCRRMGEQYLPKMRKVSTSGSNGFHSSKRYDANLVDPAKCERVVTTS